MKKENIGSVKVIPLGGLEQIGMNITAIVNSICRSCCRLRT